mmetsp:Transcript_24995/g.42731  ORF Transcript_24995/g.42731 Transcript_24995/m.42731 type:complete len:273 (+) Transcript_24995:2-820(+)
MSSAFILAAQQHVLAADTPTPQTARRSLRDLWLSYSEAPVLDHWLEYAEHYERHFPRPDGTPRKLLEIGVQSGGSARAWKQFYGAPLTYVGIDINEPCRRTQSVEEKIFVEIGSQLNGTFLRGVCDKHGPFDMVVDDGGHSYNMMGFSVETLFSHPTCLSADAVYTIEDMHTMSMCAQGYCDEPSQIYNIVGRAFGGMHKHWFAKSHQVGRAPSPWAAQVRALSLYDSIAFFQRGPKLRQLTRVIRGTDKLPNGPGDEASRHEAPVDRGDKD